MVGLDLLQVQVQVLEAWADRSEGATAEAEQPEGLAGGGRRRRPLTGRRSKGAFPLLPSLPRRL